MKGILLDCFNLCTSASYTQPMKGIFTWLFQPVYLCLLHTAYEGHLYLTVSTCVPPPPTHSLWRASLL